MPDLATLSAAIGARSPPAPIEMIRELLAALPEHVHDDEFDILIDLVLRLRADCIAVKHETIDNRPAYGAAMVDLADRLRPAFASRTTNADASLFFRNFHDAAVGIS